MNKLSKTLALTTLILSSCALFAQATTIEEAEAWMQRPLTELETTYIDLLVCATVDGDEHILYADASCIVNTPQMDNKIPRGQAKDRGWPDDVDFTLADFSLRSKDLPLNKTIFQVSAKDYSPELKQARRSYTSVDDLHIWITEIAPFGIKLSDLLNREDAAQYWEGEE